MNNLMMLEYKGFEIKMFDKEKVSLTNSWKAAGSPNNKDPRQWVRLPQTVEFVETVSKKLNVGKSHILETQRGRTIGGTYAHWQIWLAYAKYLSPEFHMWANQVIKERIEEEINPDLIVDRAINTYKKHGKSNQWISARIKCKASNVALKNTFKTHGVIGVWAGKCQNNLQQPIFGKPTWEKKLEVGLPANSPVLRDRLPEIDLAALEFAEILARTEIEKTNTFGSGQCAKVCSKTGNAVAGVLNQFNKTTLIENV